MSLSLHVLSPDLFVTHTFLLAIQARIAIHMNILTCVAFIHVAKGLADPAQ